MSDKEQTYNCSFCFKSDQEVDRLFVSFQESAAICDECILLCIKGAFRDSAIIRELETDDIITSSE